MIKKILYLEKNGTRQTAELHDDLGFAMFRDYHYVMFRDYRGRFCATKSYPTLEEAEKDLREKGWE